MFLAFLYPFLSTTYTNTNTDRTNATNTTKCGTTTTSDINNPSRSLLGAARWESMQLTGFGEILGEGNAEKG